MDSDDAINSMFLCISFTCRGRLNREQDNTVEINWTASIVPSKVTCNKLSKILLLLLVEGEIRLSYFDVTAHLK